MKKKHLILASTCLLLSSAPVVTFAESLDNQIDQSNQKIENLQQKKSADENQLKQIETDIKQLEKQTAEILKKKVALEKELNQLNEDIAQLTKAIEKRTEQINEQARSVQVNQASHTIVDAVLDSDNLSDAITKTIAYSKLVQANNDIVVAQQADQEKLESKQKELNQKLADIIQMTETLKENNEQLQKKKLDQAVLIKQVEAELAQEKSKKDGLLKEKAAAEKRRQDELKRLEAMEQVRLKALEEAKKQQQNHSNPTPTPPKANSGEFQYPIPNIHITSGFGGREDPTGASGTQHDGIDMAGSLNDPIFASRGGTVVAASYHPSAGNHIIIKHDNGYYTYYMHMTTLLVGQGETVSTGQQIGLMGTTGNSTGVHLHFGISTSVWSGFVDPGPFLGLY